MRTPTPGASIKPTILDVAAASGSQSAVEARSGSSDRVATPNSIVGVFDGFAGLHVVGWARDDSNDEVPITVDVLADGHCVASGLADLFRADLLKAGKGNGKHAFRIPLPADLCDGAKHEVSVMAGSTGTRLAPGVRVFEQSSTVRGLVEGLDGPFVMGWVRNLVRPEETLCVEMYIDGQTAARADARQPCAEGQRFALRIPPQMMDGRPHVISVQVTEPFHLIDEIALVTPSVLTPIDALRRYSGSFRNAALLEGSPARYEALRRQIELLGAQDSPLSMKEKVARLQQIAVAHEQVLRGFDNPEASFARLAPLEFAPTQKPVVTVVIPVHNKVLVTYNCLASLLLTPSRTTFEVIVVDDGSTDETLALPELVKGIKILRHEQAQGFIHSCNDGAKSARGAYVLMLNNDTEVTYGWLDELLYVFEHFEDVGLVGGKLLYPNGRLQEAGAIVWNNGDPWNYGRGGNPREPRYNYTRQVDYLSGACILLRKATWDELGGFDERFVPAYFEDADLAFRIRERNLKVVYTPFSQVIHFEGVTSGTDTNSGIKRYQEINRPKFKARWSRAFRNNGVAERDVDINKDRNVRFRALVIDSTTPRPDHDAGSYAAVQEMLILQSLGFKVTFAPDNLAFLGDPTEALQRMGVELVYAPFVISIQELLETRGKEFDLVYVTRYAIAERHLKAIRQFAPRAKIVFNVADLHFLRELRSALLTKDEENIGRALKTKEDELAVMRGVDLVLSYSDAEHAVILSHNLDSTRTARCPWVVNLPETTPDFDHRRDIGFLGNFSHFPNPQAIEYFVREVMPLVRQRLPKVSLRIYGSGIPERIRKLAAEDVIIEGWVPDVSEVLAKCRVFIAPLRSGAGIKGKVISALAFGVPCVLSPIAAEGTGIRDGQEALVAETGPQWAECIARLYEDRVAWLKIHQAARAYVGSEFSFLKGQKLMQQALESVDIFAAPDELILKHDDQPV